MPTSPAPSLDTPAPPSPDAPPAAPAPTSFERGPLHAASMVLPLLSYAIVWSAASSLLTWRHSQLIAGATGGLLLLLIRALPLNPASEASGKTPLSIAMAALVGTVAMAMPLSHPEIWSAASLTLMLAGVTVWLWYPPRHFQPFRAAAQASVALALAILLPLALELAGISPWHGGGTGIASGLAVTSTFDRSETLTAALLYTSLALVVAVWPNPLVPRRTRTGAAFLLGVLILAALFFAPGLPITAVIGFLIVGAIGTFWRANSSEGDNYVRERAARYRIGAALGGLAMLVAFSSPALLLDVEPEVFPSRADETAALHLDPSWNSADPLLPAAHAELRRAEWRAVASNLPFGAGAGAWLDETLLQLRPVVGIAPDAEPTRQAGWPDQPRSLLAASITEHGVLAAFVWALLAGGGYLLGRLVVRHSIFPTSLAAVLGLAPAIGFATIPGTSQAAPVYALLLSWFLLCAPLARAESREALKLVPTASTEDDPRRPPRGRIFILLIPALVVGWFAFSHLRWSQESARGYQANIEGDLPRALAHFERANAALPHPASYFNEARLLETAADPALTPRIEAAYEEALRRRPNAPSYLMSRAEWRLRQHEAIATGPTPRNEVALVEAALSDLETVLKDAPLWALAHQRMLECLILLDRLEDADAHYAHAMGLLMSPQNRTELRMLRVRQLAWRQNDLEAARALLDEAEESPSHPVTRYFMQHERGRLVFWENSATSPYSIQNFHEAHGH